MDGDEEDPGLAAEDAESVPQAAELEPASASQPEALEVPEEPLVAEPVAATLPPAMLEPPPGLGGGKRERSSPEPEPGTDQGEQKVRSRFDSPGPRLTVCSVRLPRTRHPPPTPPLP